jgi:hypothetical protein
MQLMSGGIFKIYVDMCYIRLGYETSEFRIIETVFINAIVAYVHPGIRRKAMRYRGFRLS